MELSDPVVIYTAATNIEAHFIVNILNTNGIAAYAVEDQTTVGLWALGTVSQVHKPQVWVDKSTAQSAADLILQFEKNKRQRANDATAKDISVQCDECGKTTVFAGAQRGTIQDCPYCNSLLDVGEPEQLEFDDKPDQS